MQDRPLISIIMTTYGHEKYIGYALDSILMQETEYSFEVLIGEDCSPDNTRAILKEYEKKHPGFFTVFYRKKNMGARANSQDLVWRASGKYLASLEGDDYWVSSNRLQKLASFLENNSTYMGVANKTIVVDQSNNPREGVRYPECKKKEFTLKQYRRGFLPGQSAATMIRNAYRDNQFDVSIKRKTPPLLPADRVTAFLWVSNGKYRCFDDVMSAYRYVPSSGTSFSANVQKKSSTYFVSLIKCYKDLLDHIKLDYSRKAVATMASLYLYQILLAVKKDRGYNVKAFFKALLEQKYKFLSCIYLLHNITNAIIRKARRKKTGYIGW